MKKIFYLLLLVALSSFVGADKKSLELNIMSFNIRYDNPSDGLNNWKYRRENVMNMIRFYEVDILGGQEVLFSQLNDMTERLSDYTSIGVGREDGKVKGEYSPILYKKSKFKLIKSGYFWLSQTPEKPSKGWDAACERIATWAQLKDKITGKKVFVLNTHFDHIGTVARQESVELIKTRVAQLSEGLPQIVMGDFNAEPESTVVKKILTPTNFITLSDSKKIASVVYGPNWSFHDFGNTPYSERRLIDYIFVNKAVKVQKYGVLSESLNETFLSDHDPVLIKVSI